MLNCGEEGVLSGKFGIHRGSDGKNGKRRGLAPPFLQNSKHEQQSF
jgi:hypothetical protein